MAEIHDASPGTSRPYALFVFVGVPPQRRGDEQSLKQNCLHQLARLFGPAAGDPIAVFATDWATEEFTATATDLQPHSQSNSLILLS